MIGFARANMDIVKAITNGEPRVCGYWMDDDRYFVTPNGFYGYVFPKNQIAFNVERVKNLDKPVFDEHDFGKDVQEIKPTKMYSQEGLTKFVRHFEGRFNGKPWRVYIDVTFLKFLEKAQGIRYFQKFSPEGYPAPILPVLAMQEKTKPTDVKDEVGRMVWGTELIPVMLILPVRVFAEDD